MAGLEFTDVLIGETVPNPLDGLRAQRRPRSTEHPARNDTCVPMPDPQPGGGLLTADADHKNEEESPEASPFDPSSPAPTWMNGNYIRALDNVHRLVSDKAVEGDVQQAMLPEEMCRRYADVARCLQAYRGAHRVEAFFFLPELLENVKAVITEGRTNPDSPLVSQHLLYVHVAIREIQTVIDSTFLDPGFTQLFTIPDGDVEMFLGEWEKFLHMVRHGTNHCTAVLISTAARVVTCAKVSGRTPGCTSGRPAGSGILDMMITKPPPVPNTAADPTPVTAHDIFHPPCITGEDDEDGSRGSTTAFATREIQMKGAGATKPAPLQGPASDPADTVLITADLSLSVTMLGVLCFVAVSLLVFAVQIVPALGMYSGRAPTTGDLIRVALPSAAFVLLSIGCFVAATVGDLTSLLDMGTEGEYVRYARYPCLLLYPIAATPLVFFDYDLIGALDGDRVYGLTGPGRMVFTYFYLPWVLTVLGAHMQCVHVGTPVRTHIVAATALFVACQVAVLIYSAVERAPAITLGYAAALLVFLAVHYTFTLVVPPVAAVTQGAHSGLREASLYRFLLMRTLRSAEPVSPEAHLPAEIVSRAKMQVHFCLPTLPMNSLALSEPRVIDSAVGIVVIDAKKKVVYWNDRMASWTGIFSQSAVGKPLRQFIVSEDDQGYQRFEELVQYGEQLDSISESVTFMWVAKTDASTISLEARLSRCVKTRSDAEGDHLALLLSEASGPTRANRQAYNADLLQLGARWENPFNSAAYCDWVVQSTMAENAPGRVVSQYSTAGLTKFLSRPDIAEEFSAYNYQTMLEKMVDTHVSIAQSKDVKLEFEPAGTVTELFTCPVELDSLVSSMITQALSRCGGGVLRIFTRDMKHDKSGVDERPEHGCVWSVSIDFVEGKGGDATAVHAAAAAGLFAQANNLGGFLTTTDPKAVNATGGVVLSLVLPVFSTGLSTAARPSVGGPNLLHYLQGTGPSSNPVTDENSLVPTMRDKAHSPLAGCRCLIVDTNDHLIRPLTRTLWEIGMSVAARGSLDFDGKAEETEKERNAYDMIVVNIEEAELSLEEFFEKFQSSTAQIIIMSTLPTEGQLDDLNAADGWYGLSLPFNRKDFDAILEKVTRAIAQLKKAAQDIEDIRQAFVGSNAAPWERGKQLGSGSFGKVYEATNTLTKGKMAVKIIPYSDNEEEQLGIFREVTLMASLSHRNIVHYFYCERGPSEIRIFMELAEASLSGKIPKGGAAADKAAGFLKDILLGLQYLHSRNIVHRDLKVPNVLIHAGVCKLTDFGTAITVKPKDKNAEGDAKEEHGLSGTPHYMAPECLEGEDFDSSSDMWSVGCMLMEMVTGKMPWAHISTGQWGVVRYVCKCYVERLSLDYNQEKVRYHPSVILFFQATLVLDAKQRLDCAKLLQSPLLNLDEDAIRKQSIFTIANEKRKQSVHHKKHPRAKNRLKNPPSPELDDPTKILLGDAGEAWTPDIKPDDGGEEEARKGSAFSGWGDD
eukprot:TRINITY_DN17670_c0_g1_i1.p1 TRINITY_DN17670_c0_g1~~TRINITY_DN17670_c0_g1_i1.p1  ORF type:complete len:1489 (+),score=435.40 TRINITY_DN17670_c0_g1_i1:138-4604(+)